MLLVVKFRNAAELFWDSLDTQERQIVLYFLVYLCVSTLAMMQRLSREKLKRELREEITRGAA